MTGCLPIARFIWVFFSLLGRHYLGPGSVGRVGYMFRISHALQQAQTEQTEPTEQTGT